VLFIYLFLLFFYVLVTALGAAPEMLWLPDNYLIFLSRLFMFPRKPDAKLAYYGGHIWTKHHLLSWSLLHIPSHTPGTTLYLWQQGTMWEVRQEESMLWGHTRNLEQGTAGKCHVLWNSWWQVWSYFYNKLNSPYKYQLLLCNFFFCPPHIMACL
jgi:hypothetical protein